MATRAIRQVAVRKVRRRVTFAALGALLSTKGLILLVIIAAVLGTVVAFSGDEEGTGQESATGCAGAGTPGSLTDLNLIAVNGAALAGLTPAMTANAAVIYQVAQAKGLGDIGAEIGVSVALAESTLQNYANDGTSTLNDAMLHRQLTDSERAVARQSMDYPHDTVGNNLDSIGLFQQRPMTGWGTPAELIDPAVASGKFYDALIGQVPNWQSMSPWIAAQTVQGSPSGDGGIYRVKWTQAESIVAQIRPLISSGHLASTTPTSVAAATGTVAPVALTSRTTTVAAPTSSSAALGTDCQRTANANGGMAGAPVVFNGNITINAPSGSSTVPLPQGPRGEFLKAVASKMGTEYVWGAAGPDVFDCSGLMSWGLTQAGVGIGRLTADDFWQTQTRIASGSEQPGDLVLFGARYGNSGMAGHIGVVIDSQQKLMMHTYTDGKPATVSRYDTWEAGGPLGFVQVIAASPAPGSTASVATTNAGVLVAAGN